MNVLLEINPNRNKLLFSVLYKVIVAPQFFYTGATTHRIMPPKRKLASSATKEPETGAASVSSKPGKKGRVGLSVDRQTSATKYGTSTRVLRSQSTDSKGIHLVSYIPKKRVVKPSQAPVAHRGRQDRETSDHKDEKFEGLGCETSDLIVRTRGKGAKKKGDEGNQVADPRAVDPKDDDEHQELSHEPEPDCSKARGKEAKKRELNEANVNINHPSDGRHDEVSGKQSALVTKTRGKEAKNRAKALKLHGDEGYDFMYKDDEKDEKHGLSKKQTVPVTNTHGKRANKKREAAQAAEEHANAEETNGSNGSEAPKEENKRGRKGKPDASKKEPEPDEKKAKLDEEPENYDCDKTNKKGEKWNLKIATWNVASLRACVKKGMLDYVAKEDADIICFQETKCSEQKAPAEAKVEGYHTYWCSGSGKNDGYAGVALFTKEKPLNVNLGIGVDEYDAEGRLITAEYDKFFLVTTYVPNSGQGLKTLPKRMKWDELFLTYLKKLDAQKPVVLCGDLNVAHEEIDLKNPKTNTKSAGFTPEERANMTKLLGEGFVDSFRHLYPDKTGAYTFWTYLGNARSKNTGWRLDYFVLSERLMESVCDVVIRNKVLGSDHCPTTLFIHI